MLSSSFERIKVGLIIASVMTLTACTTSNRAPVNYRQLGQVVEPLPGAQGKTRADQKKIDQVVAAGCSGKIIAADKCDEHTAASRARKEELRAN